MSQLKVKFSSLSIRSKIITAFLFGCIVIAFSWTIARVVFKETFATIEVISKPNPKLSIINLLFQRIQHLDYSQKVQALKLEDKSFKGIIDESQPIITLLDTLKIFCSGDSIQLNRIGRMQTLVYEREELFLNYLKYRYGILKTNPLSKDIQNLSEYVSKNLKRDSNFVKTTRKNTITTTIVNSTDPDTKSEKKESFFKRVFNKKKKEEAPQPAVKLITEDVQETVDTFAVTQRDSFMKDMERAILSIEKDRYNRRNTLVNHELKLAASSAIFVDELEQLLRLFQTEELIELQQNTESLSEVFNNAFSWVEIILCAFLLLILVLISLIFLDITRSNQTRLQLIEAKEKAEYLEQVKHRFLANMSHEIRTPLQAIIGYSEQVKDQPVADKQALQAIYRSSEHLLQIVNEVLDYSRIISGKFNFEKHNFDMLELIAEVADIMEGQAENKNILFKIKSDIPGNANYSGDSFRLKQILFNLLGNAIKFTDRGEVTFSVQAKEIGSKKTEFTFEIKDTGLGMSEEELKRIFLSFEQAAQSTQRLYGGTGLGLSIVKKLVDMQGGTIQVSSEKHKGSVFNVKLGYLNATTNKEQSPENLEYSLANYAGKVLVVDDDAFILQLSSNILTKYGVDHVCYSSSEKVLQDEWDSKIDLALIDMRMPRVNGIELHRGLQNKITAPVRFIALTAQALPDEKEAILKEGFDLVLLKPFREKELMQVIMGETHLNETPVQKNDQLDLSSIKTMCMGDEAMFKQTLDILIKETKTDLEVLEHSIASKNTKEFAGIVHKLSSKAGQMGLTNMAATLRELETKSRKEKEFDFKKENLDKLQKQIAEIVRNLEEIKA